MRFVNLFDKINGKENQVAKTNPTNIRLMYIDLQKTTNKQDQTIIAKTVNISDLYELPKDMDIKNACKVVSYLLNKSAHENNLKLSSEENVIKASDMIEEYGFKKITNNNACHYYSEIEYTPFQKIEAMLSDTTSQIINGVADLCVFSDNFNVTIKENSTNRYFNWIDKNITSNDVKNIYTKINENQQGIEK